jgi:hypothetical protein
MCLAVLHAVVNFRPDRAAGASRKVSQRDPEIGFVAKWLFWVPGVPRPNTGYLKAVWPVFGGCVFEVWPAPGAREGLLKCGGLRRPHF